MLNKIKEKMFGKRYNSESDNDEQIELFNDIFDAAKMGHAASLLGDGLKNNPDIDDKVERAKKIRDDSIEKMIVKLRNELKKETLLGSFISAELAARAYVLNEIRKEFKELQ